MRHFTWDYRDSNLYCWTVRAVEHGTINFLTDKANFLTEWRTEIRRGDSIVFSAIIRTPNDESICLLDILSSWLNNCNAVAIRMPSSCTTLISHRDGDGKLEQSNGI